MRCDAELPWPGTGIQRFGVAHQESHAAELTRLQLRGDSDTVTGTWNRRRHLVDLRLHSRVDLQARNDARTVHGSTATRLAYCSQWQLVTASSFAQGNKAKTSQEISKPPLQSATECCNRPVERERRGFGGTAWKIQTNDCRTNDWIRSGNMEWLGALPGASPHPRTAVAATKHKLQQAIIFRVCTIFIRALFTFVALPFQSAGVLISNPSSLRKLLLFFSALIIDGPIGLHYLLPDPNGKTREKNISNTQRSTREHKTHIG